MINLLRKSADRRPGGKLAVWLAALAALMLIGAWSGSAAAPAQAAPAEARRARATPTPTPAPPLHFSFHVDARCTTRQKQDLKLVVTAHGGRGPYTYYNDATLLGRQIKGSVWFTVTAPAGNPVPFKLIVVDSTGRKYMEEFFYKTYLHCG